LGINFYDTAEVYGNGEAEKQIGTALKALNVPREDLVVATKIYFGTDPASFPNTRFLSRKHIIEGMYASLERL
jgi:aryl-alcohol dehydrogenase-like predicted oxidoreductase